jgi:hypothetical protein
MHPYRGLLQARATAACSLAIRKQPLVSQSSSDAQIRYHHLVKTNRQKWTYASKEVYHAAEIGLTSGIIMMRSRSADVSSLHLMHHEL